MKKFAIKENASQSLNEAMNYLEKAEKDPSKIRISIILLDNFIELFLKYYIQSHHPLLIYTNPSSKKNHTIGTNDCLELLTKLEIKMSETLIRSIKDLREKRNEINHFEAELSIEDWKIKLGHTFYEMMEFDEKNKEKFHFRNHVSEKYWKDLIYLTEIFEKHHKKAEEEAKDNICDDKDGANPELDLICPECDLSDVSYTKDYRTAYCCFCKETYPIKRCDECGTVKSFTDFDTNDEPNDHLGTCHDCMCYKFSKED